MKFSTYAVLLLAGLLYACSPIQSDQKQAGTTDGLDRTSLPIKEPSYPNDTTLDARDAKTLVVDLARGIDAKAAPRIQAIADCHAGQLIGGLEDL